MERYERAVEAAGATAAWPPAAAAPEGLPGHYVEPTVVGGLPPVTSSSATNCSCRS